mgnify:CR=1 FL=1
MNNQNNITKNLQKRHATKAFDKQKQLSAEQIATIEATLRLSPSSVNSQPWHFLLISSEEGKERLKSGAQAPPFVGNFPKVRDSSLVVIFCAKTEVSDEYLEELIELEDQAGRFPLPEQKVEGNAGRMGYLSILRQDPSATQAWINQQIYLNLGFTMATLAQQGIDSLAVEGLDFAALDAEFDLPAQGLNAKVALAIGYGSVENFNAKLPKARWPEDRIFTRL